MSSGMSAYVPCKLSNCKKVRRAGDLELYFTFLVQDNCLSIFRFGSDFINFIEKTQVSQNTILVSIDVTGLYTNTPQDEGIIIARGEVLDISLGGEVWRGPSYPDPV